ncbi:MAG: GNAT family N-acetyltransferase [Clostridia bacterium]|nr:GNAT family N-acetyltransferase [Clostridia bacterium]
MDKKISYIIRPAEPRDSARLRELLEQICLLHVEGRPDIFQPAGKYTEDDIIAMMGDAEKPIFVADTGEDVAGYVFCQLKRPHNPVMRDYLNIYIDDLCVDDKYRRLGIGKALFGRVKQLAAELGAYNIDLNVWAFNEPAIAFYRSLGMQPERIYMELITGKEQN